VIVINVSEFIAFLFVLITILSKFLTETPKIKVSDFLLKLT
jgi:hypothetical protein